MASNDEDDDEDEPPEPTTLEGIFMEECTLAMMMGMTYEQYWFSEPEIFLAYGKLYKRQTKAEFAEQDTLAWLIGSYVDAAVGHVMSAALGEKGKPKAKYPDQPVYVTEIDEAAKAKKQEREARKYEANFLAAVHNMGKTIEEAAH